jgi:hypothetical protein
VKDLRIKNEDILLMFNLPPMENLVAKQQLRWAGKMARMDESHLPIKMLACWMNVPPRPSQRPHTTTRNSLIRSLQIIDPNISRCGTLNKWYHTAKDESVWNDRLSVFDTAKDESVWNDRLSVFDRKQSDPPTFPTQELNDDLALPSHIACDTTETLDFPFQLELNPSSVNP